MLEEIKEKTVIRYLDCDNTYTYMGHSYDYGEGYNYHDEYSLETAFDAREMSEDELLEAFAFYQKQNQGFDCEVVKISISTKIEHLFEDNISFKELRQRAALEKLSDAEIRALGLTNIAVYIKTKFHNA